MSDKVTLSTSRGHSLSDYHYVSQAAILKYFSGLSPFLFFSLPDQLDGQPPCDVSLPAKALLQIEEEVVAADVDL